MPREKPDVVTPEMLAPYGVGEPDADGWFPDYRPLPAHLKPDAPDAPKVVGARELDGSWLALVQHWSLVVADLSRHHRIVLDDPAVLALPWVGVRTLIFSLLDEPTRLQAALTKH